MSAPLILETDPLATLEGVCRVLNADDADSLDPCLLDTFSFKTAPKKWPAWTDLEAGVGTAANRSEVVRAIQDLCSKIDLALDRPAYQTTLGPEALAIHRTRAAAVRKKLSFFEDLLSSPDAGLLLALDEAGKRLLSCDEASVEPKLLDSFQFRTGKPGLFTTWTDLDMEAGKIGWPSQRQEVVAALRDLLSKAEQMVARPACQRTLGPAGLEKYRSLVGSISHRLAILGDALSPPNPQPLVLALEETERRLKAAPDAAALDAFAFCPGKPGLFTAWTDLDVVNHGTGDSNNRNAVIMALDDLLAKFDHMAARPGCQKALGPTAMEKYRVMRKTVGERLESIKNPAAHPQPAPKTGSFEQERIDAVRRGLHDPIWQPKLFSRAAWVEAGALAGGSMAAALAASMVVRPLMRLVPCIGLIAVAVTFVRRWGRINTIAKKSAAAKNRYDTAAKNADIVDLFASLTREAQARFLVGLDSEFRKSVVDKHPRLQGLCAQIDTFLLSRSENFERTNTLAIISKGSLGECVAAALRSLL